MVAEQAGQRRCPDEEGGAERGTEQRNGEDRGAHDRGSSPPVSSARCPADHADEPGVGAEHRDATHDGEDRDGHDRGPARVGAELLASSATISAKPAAP